MLGFKSFVASILLMGCELTTIAAVKGRYNVEVEAFKYVSKPDHLFQMHYLRVGKYNDTAKVITANGTYAEDLPMDAMVYCKGYQLMGSNKYSMIPVGPAPMLLCEAINKDKDFYPFFRKSTNLPEKCPVLKGNYWVKDFIPRFEALPEQLPGERWRVDCELKSGTRTAFAMETFVYIDRNI